MRMKTTAIRLPADTLTRLHVLAGLESARFGRRITWAALVRVAITRMLEDTVQQTKRQ